MFCFSDLLKFQAQLSAISSDTYNFVYAKQNLFFISCKSLRKRYFKWMRKIFLSIKIHSYYWLDLFANFTNQNLQFFFDVQNTASAISIQHHFHKICIFIIFVNFVDNYLLVDSNKCLCMCDTLKSHENLLIVIEHVTSIINFILIPGFFSPSRDLK